MKQVIAAVALVVGLVGCGEKGKANVQYQDSTIVRLIMAKEDSLKKAVDCISIKDTADTSKKK